MVKFLIYAAFFLIIIVVAYLVRINMIAKSIKANKSAEAIEKEKQLFRRIFLILLSLYMILVIWSYYYYR